MYRGYINAARRRARFSFVDSIAVLDNSDSPLLATRQVLLQVSAAPASTESSQLGPA